MTYREDLAWAGGLFEGEGCLSMTRFAGKSHRVLQLMTEVRMTDEDTVRRFGEVMGIGKVIGPHRPIGRSKKPTWLWRTRSFEDAQAVIAMLWPWLGARRRGRGMEILQAYRDYKSQQTTR